MKKLTLVSLAVCTSLYASELSNSLSNQGFSGAINTPNAQVMNLGDATIHFDNQFDNVLRGYNYKRSYRYNENYIFGVGLFKNFELQGRLSETPGYQRDLSANFKFKLPYTHKYLPNFALGFQDLGSAANFYGNKYVVMDKEFKFVRASLGYGKSDGTSEDKKRMDGVFGSIELKALEWLYIVAEDDSKEHFAALRVEMPQKLSKYFKFSTLISTNIDDNYKTNFNFNVTFPLYENKKTYLHHSVNAHQQKVLTLREKSTPQVVEHKSEQKKESAPFNLEQIKKELLSLGLENITLATKGKELYISYENSVFMQNDLDAMGIVIGLLARTQYEKFILEQNRGGLVTFTLRGDLQRARAFYENPNYTNKLLFASSLKKGSQEKLDTFDVVTQKENSSQFYPRIEFSPYLIKFVGNEFGVFNYKWWMRINTRVNLYKGFDLGVAAYYHVKDSHPSDHTYDGFLMLYENGNYVESVMLHWSENLFDGINTLSVGSFGENYKGVVDQYIYNYQNHTLKLKAGHFEQFRDGDPFKEKYLGRFPTRDFYLLKYSYLFEDYNTLLEARVGQYWNQDKGYDIKIKRFFGDVAIYGSYEQSKADNMFSEQVNKYARFGVEIPFAFEHMSTFIKGSNAYNFSLKSTILREDGTNTLVPGGNYDPYVSLSSEEYFYNRDRLQLSYIQHNAFRLIESYDKYIANLDQT